VAKACTCISYVILFLSDEMVARVSSLEPAGASFSCFSPAASHGSAGQGADGETGETERENVPSPCLVPSFSARSLSSSSSTSRTVSVSVSSSWLCGRAWNQQRLATLERTEQNRVGEGRTSSSVLSVIGENVSSTLVDEGISEVPENSVLSTS
jgi:hypothetical protein